MNVISNEVDDVFSKIRSSTTDFDASRLPSTRWQSFIDILRNRWSVLLELGGVLFAFALPLLVHLMLVRVAVFEYNLAYDQGLIDRSRAMMEIGQTLNAGNLMVMPLLLIFGIGLSGGLRILRQLIWQDNVFFFHDFKQGIKAHLRDVLVSMAAIGVSNAAMWAIVFDASNREDGLRTTFVVALSVAAFVVILMVSVYVIFGSVLYALPLYGMVKNAILLGICTMFQTLGMLLVVTLPWLVWLFPLDNWVFPVILALMVVIFPMGMLALMEHTFSVFDKYINQTHHLAIYRKGLYSDGDIQA